jgi:hypothetical protein
MIAAPWYLLSIGILVFLIGFIVAALKSAGESRTEIDPRMSDDEIMENLQGPRGSLVGNLMVFLGILMIFVSLAWRLLRGLRWML